MAPSAAASAPRIGARCRFRSRSCAALSDRQPLPVRPGGRLEFYEHVGSEPGSRSRRVHGFIAPFSKVFDGGCDPTRDTIGTLERSPFTITELHRQSTPGPSGLETIHIQGSAA